MFDALLKNSEVWNQVVKNCNQNGTTASQNSSFSSNASFQQQQANNNDSFGPIFANQQQGSQQDAQAQAPTRKWSGFLGF